MKTLFTSLILAGATIAASAQSYIGVLDGAQDGGGNRTGSGIFSLTLADNVMTITGEFGGLSGQAVNAHIHGPSPAGQNSGVLYGLFSFMTFGPENKSGSISASVPLVSGPNGTAFDIPAQLDQLNGGLWYFNIHSSTFGGGEIRGQILAVPEPSSVALAALGAVGAVAWQLRRRLNSGN